MSGRLLAAGVLNSPATRRAAARAYHRFPTGGLQRTDAPIPLTRRRIWFPVNTFHNAIIVRNVSSSFLPKLVAKFVRLPAMFGGLVLGGAAWVQYQAVQFSNSAQEMFGNAKNTVTGSVVSLWETAGDIASQTKRGWDNTKERAEAAGWFDHKAPDVSAWLQRAADTVKEAKFLPDKADRGGSNKGGGASAGGPGGRGDGDPEPPKESRASGAAAVGAAAAAYGYDADEEEESSENRDDAGGKDDQIMGLTRKMIEIRNLLQKLGQASTLNLPAIVVIGSQSSGKSSVLEAIVGHQFLPKGDNMVTRRPIELTLVNTPESRAEYGDFPDHGLRRVSDFASIQRTLTQLNMAVPESQCVSHDPIRLTIYSPNVPDLSLIDLPGYIQVVGENQPPELKHKISDLCDKYIRAPNVILAISAADVDLANSDSLRASRIADPLGERTIGVITKMDLIDPTRGASILSNKQYPLRLGYVGVVAKPSPHASGLFKRDPANLTALVSRSENTYFSAHPAEYGPGSGLQIGTKRLQKKLMTVLEKTMSVSLQSTSQAIQQELDMAALEFRVQYNNRPLSAESYVAESLDAFKHSFKQFAESFGRPEMDRILQDKLDQRVLDQLAAMYWNKPIDDLSPPPPDPASIADLPRADDTTMPYWQTQLDATAAALTRIGIGRLATIAVTSALQDHIDQLVGQSVFVSHPFAKQAITSAASSILDGRLYTTSDHLENWMKPFKFEIDMDEREWNLGREHVGPLLERELEQCQAAMTSLTNEFSDKRKLKEVMKFIDRTRRGEVVVEDDRQRGAGGFSAELLAKGREAIFLRDRADIIKMRILAVKSKQCRTLKNKYHCPEVFLDTVATKLAAMSVRFLNVELLSEFYYQFPRELDTRLGRHLSEEQVELIAQEDPRIKRHLEVIRRKELLELVLAKIDGLIQLDGRQRGRVKMTRRIRGEGGAESGSWGGTTTG